MSKGKDWVDERLGQAKAAYPDVAERVVSRLRGLLKSQLRPRQLGTAELAITAKTLIEDMVTEEAPRPNEGCED